MRCCYEEFVAFYSDRAHEFPDYTSWICSDDVQARTFRQGWARAHHQRLHDFELPFDRRLDDQTAALTRLADDLRIPGMHLVFQEIHKASRHASYARRLFHEARKMFSEEPKARGPSPHDEFTRVRHHDNTVHTMLERGASLEEIIVQLVDIRADLEKRLLNVERLLPRKFTDDKGQTWVYRCPSHLVPDIGVAVTSEPELLTALRRIVRADTPRPLGGIADEGERQLAQFEFDLERAEAREYARAVLARYQGTMELAPTDTTTHDK